MKQKTPDPYNVNVETIVDNTLSLENKPISNSTPKRRMYLLTIQISRENNIYVEIKNAASIQQVFEESQILVNYVCFVFMQWRI